MNWFNCAVVIALIAATNADDASSLPEEPVQTSNDLVSTAWNLTENSSLPTTDEPYWMRMSINDVIHAGINIIKGMPLIVLISVLNIFCYVAMHSNITKPHYTPDISELKFLYMTKRNHYNVSLASPGDLVKIPEFNQNGMLVVLITGWTAFVSDKEIITTMSDAFKCRSDVNFVVVDSGRYVATLYHWSAFNSKAIGYYIAVALASLYNENNVRKIHVIGHSLGAQISGAVGRSFEQITNQRIPHITGLDPARPCFYEREYSSGLFRGDADFVDIIHTNPGILGQLESHGDIDFHPNGVNPIQPACLGAICAHSLAWYLYAEASYPGNEMAFMATKCDSLNSLDTGQCSHSPKTSMGPSVNKSAKGDYFLHTYLKSPYGLDSNPDKMTC